MELSYAEYINYMIGYKKMSDDKFSNSLIEAYYVGYYTSYFTGFTKNAKMPNEIFEEAFGNETKPKFNKEEAQKEIDEILEINRKLGI